MDRAIAAIAGTIDAELARARLAAVDSGRDVRTGLRETVERLVTVLEHTERGGELAFSIDMPATLTVAMPAEHLSELLGAVLENAVRHARRQVRVSAATEDGTLVVAVEDDGPGIASEQMRAALARGGRLDESGSGTGLGLAIARELAEATGGSIELGGSTLGGLLVTFRWPTSG
ncbi:ATP-binding protein [Arenimonas daejeonensis]|uniref:ATP-binding protein n=1 Tax=Arenimonas daejeonensis TaxID=370777 RepID=UPI002AD2F42F|nr:ATP-binding protein [Arenimonas daejeonensis]